MIYLSGPMTGIEDFNFPAFNRETLRLRNLGYKVINPAELNADTSKDWHYYLRNDIKALCDCNTLALMVGWENSKGAHLELSIAHRLGLKIVKVEDLK